jgi:hypothetical protein
MLSSMSSSVLLMTDEGKIEFEDTFHDSTPGIRFLAGENQPYPDCIISA